MGPHSRSSPRRSSTPNLKLSPAHVSAPQTADPASPPDTPIASPHFSRKDAPAAFYLFANPLARDPNIRPYGSGHQFSYRPLEQLSPRSSSSSGADEEDASDDESSESASVVSLPDSPSQAQRFATGKNASAPHEWDACAYADADADAGAESDASSESDSEADERAESDKPKRTGSAHGPATSILDNMCSFTIEDVDPMDSECEGLAVLRPAEIESDDESPRSRSPSRPRELDKGMMEDLENLHCSNEASDNEAEPEEDDAESEFMRRQQELKRIRRVSMSSSFGKRTHSELSDSDDNDSALDVNEAGSSASRFRKRINRGSLLFQDPPAPRIDELEEPNSDEDEYANEMRIAQGLPYHGMEVMDTDSS
ncbi:hypothetical protein BBK36DRAFT_1130480 [Trichoderma citrinoviride]|uniref:Uncharacterized protein n=1 Tax=Trichoderma citrinoviride TaxID=58853 RepID=A0A2T4AXW9_9HYPO|nr:hypothetical protein BBK36DRAFT_1130480 [Trichoderma citrinoviride]PTB61916.1 hypothetical protein BBK36DRAFT_1130480 [Trichoderma citrinoviride]